MSWQLYRWTWRLEGSLFVGTSPAGALNRCRLYVPARAMWGAVTAELARLEGGQDERYRQVGDELRTYARFSYLYPAELVAKDWLAWLPEYRGKGDGLVWVREDICAPLPDRRFRRRLLWTRPATAIDPDNNSALDGSLRETECVQSYWRHDDGSPGSPVAMVGYLFFRNNENLAERLFVLNALFVGGDTRYGLGCLQRVATERATALFGATVDRDHDEPSVLTNRALAHAHAGNGAAMCGDREAIGGWDMTRQQQACRICGPVWTPGTRIVNQGETPRFRIDEDGLWRIDGQSTAFAPPKGAPSS